MPIDTSAQRQTERVTRTDRYVIDCALDVIVARPRPPADRDDAPVSPHRPGYSAVE